MSVAAKAGERIDDVLASLGHQSDWAQNQQEAARLLAENAYDLVLLDLQIPSRPGGKDLAEFGKNLLKQIRTRPVHDRIPVILMTAQYQRCVDLMTELTDLGLDGSIAKPFPDSGRTLAVVIEEVMEKHRRFRQATAVNIHDQTPEPFGGGVLAFYPDRVELCGEIIAERGEKGYGWQILHILREVNDRGRYIALGSTALGARLDSKPVQNTLIRSIGNLRRRISRVILKRLGENCPPDGVIVNDEQGYHLRSWIVVEVYDDGGTLTGKAGTSSSGNGTHAAEEESALAAEQQWILAQLESKGRLTRREVQDHFDVAERTAKRYLRELTASGQIEYDRSAQPGFYRLP